MTSGAHSRVWPVVGLATLGLTLVAASFYVGREVRGGSDPATAKPGGPIASDHASDQEEDSRQDEETATVRPIQEEIERLQATSDADYAKTPFAGALGDFLVVPEGRTAGDPTLSCNDAVMHGEPSPDGALVFPVPPGAELPWTVFRCGDGTIVVVSLRVRAPHGLSVVNRYYFLDDVLPASIRAPRERLELRTVAGMSAIVELPAIAEAAFSRGQIYVIERVPVGETPGIAWSAHYDGPVEEGIAFLASVIESSRR